MQIVRSETVGNRSDLARLCNARMLKTAVEVGTDRGIFAAEFLSKWDGEMLLCVDDYKSYPEMPWDRSADMHMAIHVLAKEARRVRIIKDSSKNVADYFGSVPNWPVKTGLVYIDGAHDYKSVLADIHSWWNVVQDGGILSGDDFDEHHEGVKRAVIEFAGSINTNIHLSTDFHRGPSWFIHK